MLEKKNANPNAIAGSNLLDLDVAALTAVGGNYSQILNCGHCNHIAVDLNADKGCTIVITPVLSVDNDEFLGLPGDPEVLGNGGGVAGAEYQRIGAPRVKVTVTKDEAGDCNYTRISVRGLV